MKKYIIPSIIISSLSIISCNTDFDTDLSDIAITNGNADFSTYVSLGNSLTSGHRDGALYRDGQLESYPAIIAKQMQQAGGGEFTQPLIPNNTGGFSDLPSFTGKYTLKVINGTLLPVPSPAGGNLDKLTGSFNNMGVSGAKSFHLITPNYGDPAGLSQKTANPYFVRFASSPNTTILADAIAKKPTFFSLWIGNNDVLSYAMSGGTGINQTGNLNPKTYSSNDITDPTVLANSIKNVLDGLKNAGANKGIIANIPNVASIPFFTTIPYNAIPLTQDLANELNQKLLSKLKAGLTALGAGDRISLAKEGKNPILIKDKSLLDLSAQITMALKSIGSTAAEAEFLGKTYGQTRHTTEGDFVLLTTRAVLNTEPFPNFKYGISYPLEDQHILTKTEVKEIQVATDAYNTHIKSLADAYGLAFVDANSKMIELSRSSGIQYNGVTYNTTFASGGPFSLDGVHLTGKGAAIIANEFIKAINTKYQSNLRQVNPNHYSGVKFP